MIVEVLAKIQQKIKAEKTAHGEVRYTYRKLDDILEAYKKASKDLNTSLICSDEMIFGENGEVYIKGIAKIYLCKGENVESLESVSFCAVNTANKFMSKEQTFGSASTYARKKALEGLLALDDSEDADKFYAEFSQIESLIEKTNTDKAKFLEYFKVSDTQELKGEQIQKAISMLNKKFKKETK